VAWTPAQDSVLSDVVENAPFGASWQEIAALYVSAAGGDPVTEDSVRNRAKRLGLKKPEQVATDPLIIPEAEGFVGLRTLYADIEATDLGAAFGHLLCCSFCDEFGNVETYRLDDPRFAGRNLVDDGRLAAAIRDRLEQADVVVGHNFRLYDRPFINARLVRAGERPIRQDQKYIDTLFLAGGQNLRLGSRRLETIAKFLRLPNQKTPLDGETWQLAGVGVKEAMDLVVNHCEHDVLVERDVFAYLRVFVSVIHR